MSSRLEIRIYFLILCFKDEQRSFESVGAELGLQLENVEAPYTLRNEW